MPHEHLILCGTAPQPARTKGADAPLRLRLWGPKAEVDLRADDLARPVAKNIPSVFSDLIELATYIYVADQAVTRGGDGVGNIGAEWRRRLRFTVPVRNRKVWRSREMQAALVETLSFLSEDEYHFDFVDLKDGPSLQEYLPFAQTGQAQPIEEVILFSGGLDSVGGAVQEVVRDKRSVALVNHRPTEKLARRYRRLQELLEAKAKEVGAKAPIHVPVHINKQKGLGREYTQRSRSFLYASIAATVAQAYELSRIRFYENGVVSLNLPLSPQVVGAKATRTTHPRVINGFARILSLVADRDFKVENPFLWKTKAEVVKEIVDRGCGEMVKYSTSCTHTWEMTKLKTHCGTCSQCIDRRFAVLSAGAGAFDPADAYSVDLLVDARAEGEPRTMLAAYVETASEVTKLSATDFFSRYGEVGRVVNHVDGSPDTVALRMYELYQRRSKEVVKVVDDAISTNASAIRNRDLPESCLLRLVCDSSLPAAGAVNATASAPAPIVEPKVALAPFVFKKKGQAWVIRHDSGDDFVLLPSKGAAYLHLLLSRQGQSVSAVNLAFEVARVPQNFQLGSAGERSDQEAQAAYRARLADIQEDLAEAERDNDEASVERLRGERDSLIAEVKNHGWAGRAKKDHDDRDRVRKSVGIAIRRAIEQIGKYDQKFVAHLKPHLHCGNHPVYRPPSAVDWDL